MECIDPFPKNSKPIKPLKIRDVIEITGRLTTAKNNKNRFVVLIITFEDKSDLYINDLKELLKEEFKFSYVYKQAENTNNSPSNDNNKSDSLNVTVDSQTTLPTNQSFDKSSSEALFYSGSVLSQQTPFSGVIRIPLSEVIKTQKIDNKQYSSLHKTVAHRNLYKKNSKNQN
uniref:Uncharacterized protein n=1 Tax=Strongyloides venezuelensis TaxID=75913 RepID=A0A0K0FQ57_STRVS